MSGGSARVSPSSLSSGSTVNDSYLKDPNASGQAGSSPPNQSGKPASDAQNTEEGGDSGCQIDPARPSKKPEEAKDTSCCERLRCRTLGQTLFLTVAMPSSLVLPIVLFGYIFATIEGWAFVDGMLYVGGNLVLLPLCSLVPVSTAGRIVDILNSCSSLGCFAWLIALQGTMPVCADTTVALQRLFQRCAPPNSVRADVAVFLTFICIVVPLATALCALPLGAVLSLAEGWPFADSVEYVMGIIANAPALAPPTLTPTNVHSKIIVLMVATCAITVVAWSGGVVAALPSLGDAVHELSHKITALSPAPNHSVGGHLIAFVFLVVIVVPVFCFPFIFATGCIVTLLEDWSSFMDGALHVAGNVLMVPLVNASIPVTVGGKITDFIVSCVGVGAFGFMLAFFGALPFVCDSMRLLGGSKDGVLASILFALLSFLLVLPLVCGLIAIPLAGLIALLEGEGWTIVDAWLFIMSVLVQSPGLAPSTLPQVESDMSKLALFVAFVWGVSMSIGWGVGVMATSLGLNQASNFIIAILHGDADSGSSPGGTKDIQFYDF